MPHSLSHHWKRCYSLLDVKCEKAFETALTRRASRVVFELAVDALAVPWVLTTHSSVQASLGFPMIAGLG